MTHPIIQKLTPGDLRTTGKADEVANQILKDSSLVKIILKGIQSNSPGLKMRSADALEKACKKNPKIAQPHAKHLIKIAEVSTQQEVQWHMAQILSYLNLSNEQERKAKNILFKYLDTTNSNIVKTFSVQTLFEISQRNKQFEKEISERIDKEYKAGSPAIRKRIEILQIPRNP